MNQLSVVLQLALSPVEEEAFTNFLQNCRNPRADDMHVMYYLERCRWVYVDDGDNGHWEILFCCVHFIRHGHPCHMKQNSEGFSIDWCGCEVLSMPRLFSVSFWKCTVL
jgi:hypothetical protein